jgi:transcriptional regulator with XRE-family HTH domain
VRKLKKTTVARPGNGRPPGGRPSPEDLETAAEEGPFRQGHVMALLVTIFTLRRERDRQGLTLAEVSERSGLDKGLLSRLENGRILNPTVSTLWRYAEAIGARVALAAEGVPVNARSPPGPLRGDGPGRRRENEAPRPEAVVSGWPPRGGRSRQVAPFGGDQASRTRSHAAVG